MEATQATYRLALVCEEATTASLFLGKSGLTVETYHPQAIHESSTEHALDYIRMKRYELIWLEVPRSGRSVYPRRRKSTYRKLSLWVRSASSSGIPATIIGLQGHAVRDLSIEFLISDQLVTEGVHQLCAYGIKINNSMAQSSSVVYHTYSTQPFADGRCMERTEYASCI